MNFPSETLPRKLHGRRGVAVTLLFALLAAVPSSAWSQDVLLRERQLMVEEQVRQRGIEQPALLDAMVRVPRHLFVDERARSEAYLDKPLPTESGETVSQPYLSARMIELLGLREGDRVLEIGTGSGYDAALLAQIAGEVFTVEIDPAMAEAAEQRFAELGYDNVRVRAGDGFAGWPEQAPFDAILLTAATPDIPEALLEQLKVNGRMVVAVGAYFQDLTLITKTASGEQVRSIMPVRLRPLRQE
ncbi:MAG: protein-L-isoaspartate(D-aspartate) O-methyltransferase [Acidobacteriota bacterium]